MLVQPNFFTHRCTEGSGLHDCVGRGVVSAQTALDSDLIIGIASERGQVFFIWFIQPGAPELLVQSLCHVMLSGSALQEMAVWESVDTACEVPLGLSEGPSPTFFPQLQTQT